MSRSVAPMALLIALVVWAWAAPVWAVESHIGKVVTAGMGTLVIECKKDGETQEFAVPDGTKITLDGKPAKLVDIAAGAVARVIAEDHKGKLTASRIEAHSAG